MTHSDGYDKIARGYRHHWGGSSSADPGDPHPAKEEKAARSHSGVRSERYMDDPVASAVCRSRNRPVAIAGRPPSRPKPSCSENLCSRTRSRTSSPLRPSRNSTVSRVLQCDRPPLAIARSYCASPSDPTRTVAEKTLPISADVKYGRDDSGTASCLGNRWRSPSDSRLGAAGDSRLSSRTLVSCESGQATVFNLAFGGNRSHRRQRFNQRAFGGGGGKTGCKGLDDGTTHLSRKAFRYRPRLARTQISQRLSCRTRYARPLEYGAASS